MPSNVKKIHITLTLDAWERLQQAMEAIAERRPGRASAGEILSPLIVEHLPKVKATKAPAKVRK
jgi:phage tail protein X